MFDEWCNGLAFRATWCCDTQVPRDDQNAGDHNGNQDPGTGGEKDVCDWNVHSDFPLFDLMGNTKNLTNHFARR